MVISEKRRANVFGVDKIYAYFTNVPKNNSRLPGEDEDDEVGDGFIIEEMRIERETEKTTEIGICRMLDLSLKAHTQRNW